MGFGVDDTECSSIENTMPTEFKIGSIYPNPFNPKCEFRILNPKIQKVDISVLNLKGQLLKIILWQFACRDSFFQKLNGQLFNLGLIFYRNSL